MMHNGEPVFCEAELALVAEMVPVLGIRATARHLDRNPTAVLRHARRLGVESPFGFGKFWKGKP